MLTLKTIIKNSNLLPSTMAQMALSRDQRTESTCFLLFGVYWTDQMTNILRKCLKNSTGPHFTADLIQHEPRFPDNWIIDSLPLNTRSMETREGRIYFLLLSYVGHKTNLTCSTQQENPIKSCPHCWIREGRVDRDYWSSIFFPEGF